MVFEKKHRTTDHMFVLKNIMDKYKLDRKMLHIEFVEFRNLNRLLTESATKMYCIHCLNVGYQVNFMELLNHCTQILDCQSRVVMDKV